MLFSKDDCSHTYQPHALVRWDLATLPLGDGVSLSTSLNLSLLCDNFDQQETVEATLCQS